MTCEGPEDRPDGDPERSSDRLAQAVRGVGQRVAVRTGFPDAEKTRRGRGRLPGSRPRDGACRTAVRVSAAYLTAACIIALATGAARPLPLTSERAASDCSTITATATSLPLPSDLA